MSGTAAGPKAATFVVYRPADTQSFEEPLVVQRWPVSLAFAPDAKTATGMYASMFPGAYAVPVEEAPVEDVLRVGVVAIASLLMQLITTLTVAQQMEAAAAEREALARKMRGGH